MVDLNRLLRHHLNAANNLSYWISTLAMRWSATNNPNQDETDFLSRWTSECKTFRAGSRRSGSTNWCATPTILRRHRGSKTCFKYISRLRIPTQNVTRHTISQPFPCSTKCIYDRNSPTARLIRSAYSVRKCSYLRRIEPLQISWRGYFTGAPEPAAKAEAHLDCQRPCPGKIEWKKVSYQHAQRVTNSTTAAPLGLQSIVFPKTYNIKVQALADPPAAISPKIPRLNVLVLVLGEKDQRLAGHVTLANICDRCVHHTGGCAGSTLLVKGWQECYACRANSVLCDGPLQEDVRKSCLDAIYSINVRRRSAGIVGGIYGEDVRELSKILGIEQSGLVGNQFLDVENIGRRAKSKRAKEKGKERWKLHVSAEFAKQDVIQWFKSNRMVFLFGRTMICI